MASRRNSAGSGEQTDLGFSVRRSLVTPYVPYTIYVLAYTVFGVALGVGAGGSLDPLLVAGVGAAIWFGLEGLHAIDLADDGVAVRLDNAVANRLGYVQLVIGVSLGVTVSYFTSWWYLALVGVGGVLGLAYNEEWFGGLLHDRDKLTGLGNFGLTWGATPFLAGYFVVNQSVSLGVAVVACGVAIDAVRLNYLEGHGKLPRYDDVGIEHTRENPSTGDEARAACHMGNVINIGAWVLVGVGTALLFVV